MWLSSFKAALHCQLTNHLLHRVDYLQDIQRAQPQPLQYLEKCMAPLFIFYWSIPAKWEIKSHKKLNIVLKFSKREKRKKIESKEWKISFFFCSGWTYHRVKFTRRLSLWYEDTGEACVSSRKDVFIILKYITPMRAKSNAGRNSQCNNFGWGLF